MPSLLEEVQGQLDQALGPRGGPPIPRRKPAMPAGEPVTLESLQGLLAQAKAQPTGLGRPRSALHAGIQGAVEPLASVPKSLALIPAQAKFALRKRFDEIDRGAQPRDLLRPQYGPDLVNSVTRQYYGAGPEERAEIRRDYQFTDPRQTSLYAAGESLSRATREAFPTNPAYEGEFLAEQLPRGIGSTAGFLAAGALTRGVGMSPLAGAGALGAMMQGSEQFTDALRNEASFEDAFKAANLGALAGTTEALPIARVLDRFDAGTGGTLSRVLIEAAKGGSEEAAQELAQTLASNLIASGLVEYDPERGLFTGAGDAAGVGFSVGALFSTVASMLGARRRGARPPRQKPALEQPPSEAPLPARKPFVEHRVREGEGAPIPPGMPAERGEPFQSGQASAPERVFRQNVIRQSEGAPIPSGRPAERGPVFEVPQPPTSPVSEPTGTEALPEAPSPNRPHVEHGAFLTLSDTEVYEETGKAMDLLGQLADSERRGEFVDPYQMRASTLHDSGGLEGAFALWPNPSPDLCRPFSLV